MNSRNFGHCAHCKRREVVLRHEMYAGGSRIGEVCAYCAFEVSNVNTIYVKALDNV